MLRAKGWCSASNVWLYIVDQNIQQEQSEIHESYLGIVPTSSIQMAEQNWDIYWLLSLEIKGHGVGYRLNNDPNAPCPCSLWVEEGTQSDIK